MLANAASQYAESRELEPLGEQGMACYATHASIYVDHSRSSESVPGAFPILESASNEAQQRIEAAPDQHWVYNKTGRSSLLDKAGYLLVTAGQDTSTGRVTAVASENPLIGRAWMPVPSVSFDKAKAAAVFLNSTPGRLLLMRNPGRKLSFPKYPPRIINALPVPNLDDPRIRYALADCWEMTRSMEVPQYRAGECEVRQFWDAAVCDALGWDEDEIAGYRNLLHEEPHIKGLGYGQFADEPDGEAELNTKVSTTMETRSRTLRAGEDPTGFTRSEHKLEMPADSPASDPRA
ncbi:MAG: hypothetical protein OXE79_00180 [Acidimicrobiaceae bacterium]|nr:hypothetical protein [Acidimicrobiaceae bacterium]